MSQQEGEEFFDQPTGIRFVIEWEYSGRPRITVFLPQDHQETVEHLEEARDRLMKAIEGHPQRGKLQGGQ